MKKDIAYAMTPMKIFSWPVGTWPLQEYNAASASRCILAISSQLLMMIMVQIEMYLDRSDSEKNLDAVAVTYVAILAVLKITCFRVRSAGLVFNFTSAVKDYNELDSVEKQAIMRRHAYMGRVAGASVMLFAYFTAALFAAVSMFASGEEETPLNANETKAKSTLYPLPSEYALQVLRVPDRLFLLIFILQYLMMLVTCNGNLGSDAVFFGITFHLCGQAEILKLEFAKIVNDNENTARSFDALTARHRHLLKLSEQLNDTISSILIVQLFCSCLAICTTGENFLHLYSVV